MKLIIILLSLLIFAAVTSVSYAQDEANNFKKCTVAENQNLEFDVVETTIEDLLINPQSKEIVFAEAKQMNQPKIVDCLANADYGSCNCNKTQFYKSNLNYTQKIHTIINHSSGGLPFRNI